MGGRSTREGVYVYIQLIHYIVQQKVTQHCKEILLQWKKKPIAYSNGYKKTLLLQIFPFHRAGTLSILFSAESLATEMDICVC